MLKNALSTRDRFLDSHFHFFVRSKGHQNVTPKYAPLA